MKRLMILTICFLVMLVMGACGSGSNKSNSTKGTPSEKKNYGDNYKQACEDLEFGEAHKILDKKRNYYVDHGSGDDKDVYDYYFKEGKWPGFQEYVDADVYIFREEVTYLMNIDDPNVENRIFKLLMEMPMDGTPLDEGYHDDDIVEMEYLPASRQAWTYYYCIKRYNEKCNIILDLSILLGKQSMAKKVLSYYKDNMHIEKAYKGDKITVKGKPFKFEKSYSCYVWYDTDDKAAAQKKYDEAVKNGAFE